jgi:cation transporter-like permease
MKNEEVSALDALKVWWAYTWRAALGAFGLAVALGFVAGLVAVMAHIGNETFVPVAQILGGIVGTLWSVYAMRLTLQTKFRGFRIVLVREDTGA